MTRRAVLRGVAGAVLALNLIGWAISVAAELPAEFDGVRDDVLADSVTAGTLLAAPLTALVALIVLSLLAWFGGRWLGSVGLLGLIALGVVFTIGNLGEPLDPEASDPPTAFLVTWRIVAVGLCGALIVAAAVQMVYRVRGIGPPG
jgi:hypothetical protein